MSRTTFEECLSKLTSTRLVVDCETTGLKLYQRAGQKPDGVVGVAVRSGESNFYFPVRHSGGKNLEASQYYRLLMRLEQSLIVNHHTSFDMRMLEMDGFHIPHHYVDTITGTYLYNENESHKLKTFCDAHLGSGSSAEASALDKLLGSWGLQKNEMGVLDPSLVAPYACQDVVLADQLDGWLRASLYDPALYDELCRYECLLARMSRAGMHVDRAKIYELRREARLGVLKAEGEIRALAGRPLNPNSSKQVTEWLGLPDSTDATLAKHNSPGAEAIRNYRAYLKGINTYYDPYLALMDPDGRIHTRFRVDGTVSGRISTSEPNLMAIPRNSEEQKVKHVFDAAPGHVLAELDLSQAEIRMQAHYTGDPGLLEIFRTGQDTHSAVAKELGVTRHQGKTINLGIAYGMGAGKLAESLSIPEKTARDFLDRYHKAYPGVRRMANLATKAAERRGWVESYVGRRRHFNSVKAEPRKAFNFLLQGGVGDMVRRIMLKVEEAIPEAKIRLQVHDSLVLEIEENGKELEVMRAVQHVMTNQPWSRVPIKADAKMGKTWGAMKDVQLG